MYFHSFKGIIQLRGKRWNLTKYSNYTKYSLYWKALSSKIFHTYHFFRHIIDLGQEKFITFLDSFEHQGFCLWRKKGILKNPNDGGDLYALPSAAGSLLKLSYCTNNQWSTLLSNNKIPEWKTEEIKNILRIWLIP